MFVFVTYVFANNIHIRIHSSEKIIPFTLLFSHIHPASGANNIQIMLDRVETFTKLQLFENDFITVLNMI